MTRAYKNVAQSTRNKLRRSWQLLLATKIDDRFDEDNFRTEIETALTNWQAQIGRSEATPSYLTYACRESHAKGDAIDWSFHELAGHDFDVYCGLLNACADAGARLFMTTYVRAHRENDDGLPEAQSDDDVDYRCRGRKSGLPTTRKVVHSLIDTRDFVCENLPTGALNFRANDAIQDKPLCDCPNDQPCSSPMLVIVPDMYEFVLDILDGGRCAVADLLDYLRLKHSRKENRLIIDAVLSKIIDTEETRNRDRLRKASCWVDVPVYTCESDRLVPALIACHEMQLDFLLMKAFRCLRGAPVSVFSKLLELCPTFPFDLIRDDLQYAVNQTQSLSTRFHALKTLFKGKACMELANKRRTDPTYTASSEPIELVDAESYIPEDEVHDVQDESGIEKYLFEVERNGFYKKVSFAKTIQQQLPTSLGQWFVLQMEELLTAKQVLALSNYGAMMQFISVLGKQGNTYFLQKILPSITKSTEDMFEVIGLLNNLALRPKPLSLDTVRETFKMLLPNVLDLFKPQFGNHSPLTLMSNYIALGLPEDACSIAETAILSYRSRHRSQDYTRILPPFLRAVATVVKDKTFDTEVEAKWQTLYRASLQCCIQICAEDKPVKPSPARQPITCTQATLCPTCIAINAFLTSTDVESTRIEDGRKIDIEVQPADWRHAERQLDKIKDCRTTSGWHGRLRYIAMRKTWHHYEDKHKTWEKYVHDAKARLAEIDRDVLQRMLGDKMEHIVEMRDLEMRPHVDVAAAEHMTAATPTQEQCGGPPGEARPLVNNERESCKRTADAAFLDVEAVAAKDAVERRAHVGEMMRRYLAA